MRTRKKKNQTKNTRPLFHHSYLPQTLQANSGKGSSPFVVVAGGGGFAGFVTGRVTVVDTETFELLVSELVVVFILRFGSDGFIKLKETRGNAK